MQTHHISVHRACRLLNISRTVYGYECQQCDDTAIKQALLALAEKYPRYGFGMMFTKIRRKGNSWNHKRVYRVYRELGLNLKRKPKKRLPSREKIALHQPEQLNMSWSMDFMSDALAQGSKFRTVNILDDCNREALGIKASRSFPAQHVTAFLDEIAADRGYPQQLRVDNGPENISKTMVDWAKKNSVNMLYIEPGKPAQNAYIERFNRTYREEVLDMYLFHSIEEVQAITDAWLHEYNHDRPHQALGGIPPREHKSSTTL